MLPGGDEQTMRMWANTSPTTQCSAYNGDKSCSYSAKLSTTSSILTEIPLGYGNKSRNVLQLLSSSGLSTACGPKCARAPGHVVIDKAHQTKFADRNREISTENGGPFSASAKHREKRHSLHGGG